MCQNLVYEISKAILFVVNLNFDLSLSGSFDNWLCFSNGHMNQNFSMTKRFTLYFLSSTFLSFLKTWLLALFNIPILGSFMCFLKIEQKKFLLLLRLFNLKPDKYIESESKLLIANKFQKINFKSKLYLSSLLFLFIQIEISNAPPPLKNTHKNEAILY